MPHSLVKTKLTKHKNTKISELKNVTIQNNHCWQDNLHLTGYRMLHVQMTDSDKLLYHRIRV